MRLITLEKNASDLSLEISKLKQGIASGKEGSPQADLALVIDLTLELNRKLQLIESLTKQLISLTGTSAIISDKDLVLSNFTVPRNFYIRSKGSLKLESPVQSRLQTLDQSLPAGSALQPGNTAVFSIALQTRQSTFFRPIQYNLQYSINYSFDPKRLSINTNTANQSLTIRAPITSVMTGSLVGGLAGYCAQEIQTNLAPQHLAFQFLPALIQAALTAILSAMAVVFFTAIP